MPTSDYAHIPAVLREVERLMPNVVADLGIGFGKWGALLRELLDARYGRCRPEQWEARLVGYEVHSPYGNPLWDLYTTVRLGDFRARPIRGFDLVLMMDSLEHLNPAEGAGLLDALVAENKHVIVSVPNGIMEQGEVYGNTHEAHLTTYLGPEFDRFNHETLHVGLCRVESIKGAK
jgi:hypothetical protein